MGGDLADELDFDTLEALPTGRISGGLVQRQVDLLWKIRFRGGRLHLLILLEFQSEIDHFMALRILTYTCLTYEELVRRRELGAGDKLPPVLPVTVYNGRARWRAAADISQLIAPERRRRRSAFCRGRGISCSTCRGSASGILRRRTW